jgi:hypothetical protein
MLGVVEAGSVSATSLPTRLAVDVNSAERGDWGRGGGVGETDDGWGEQDAGSFPVSGGVW